jgi:iron complex outermembrane receptor protein
MGHFGKALRYGVAVAALTAVSAGAQETASTETGDEIVVTAQKRTERLQDVPISINVTSGDTLESQGIAQFITLQAKVPNLSITDTPANASLFIRGIGTSGNSFSFEQSVALFVDGIYGGRNRQFMQPFFDVERIEVLRGPQGALFGRNTSAGAISVTSRRPTKTFEGTAAAEYEIVRDSYSVQSSVSGPLSDTFAVRLAGRYNDNNGWLRNTTLNRDEATRNDVTLRGSALWEPSDSVTMFAKLEYNDTEITGQPFVFVPAGTTPRYVTDTDDAFVPLRDNSDALNGSLQFDFGLGGDHTLTAITGYSRYDYVNSFNIQARRPVRLVVDNAEDFKQWSQEVRIASPTGGAIDYIFGGYAETSESSVFRKSVIDLPPPPAPNQETERTFDQDTDVLAAFGQFNWSFAEQFKIGGGLRWTQIKKKGAIAGFARNFLLPTGNVVVPRAPLTGQFKETDWSPSVTLTWQPNRDVNIYGKFAEGAKGGAFSEFQAVTAATFILRPETSKTYELGSKFSFPDVRGFLNLALFTTKYTDLQKSSLDINTASFITSNAAGARTKGIELDAGFRPTDALRVSFAAAYLDATYTSYPNGPCRFPTQVGCTTQDRSGDRIQNSPKWTGNIGLDLDQPLNDRLRFLGSWNTNYQSDINYQDSLSPLEVQKAFSKTDVRGAIAADDKAWEVGLLVRNLFNKKTSGLIFQVFPVGVAPNDRAHLLDARRTFTLQGRVRF